MGKTSMRLVKPQLEASSVMDKGIITSYICDVYISIKNREELKYLPSFILFVCCVIEECYSSKSIHTSKINKLEEACYHIAQFLGKPQLEEEEKTIIIRIIEDLHSSGRIKRISRVQKLVFTIGSFFLKT